MNFSIEENAFIDTYILISYCWIYMYMYKRSCDQAGRVVIIARAFD